VTGPLSPPPHPKSRILPSHPPLLAGPPATAMGSDRADLARLCSCRNWSKAIRLLDSILAQSPSSVHDLWYRALLLPAGSLICSTASDSRSSSQQPGVLLLPARPPQARRQGLRPSAAPRPRTAQGIRTQRCVSSVPPPSSSLFSVACVCSAWSGILSTSLSLCLCVDRYLLLCTVRAHNYLRSAALMRTN
jgi:hypothetical protein